jgi:hypothetical protein
MLGRLVIPPSGAASYLANSQTAARATPAAGSKLLTMRFHQTSLFREIGFIRPGTQAEDKDSLVQSPGCVQAGALIRPILAQGGDYQVENILPQSLEGLPPIESVGDPMARLG